jgi:hypothetical protein
MKLSNLLLVAAFAGEAVASWGFGKSSKLVLSISQYFLLRCLNVNVLFA